MRCYVVIRFATFDILSNIKVTYKFSHDLDFTYKGYRNM